MAEANVPNIKVTVEAPKEVSITMTADSHGKRMKPLKQGETYSLPQDSADFQVRLGRAVYAHADNNVASSDADAGTGEESAADKAVDDMTVAELTAALTAAGVAIPSGSVKSDLVKLFKKNIGK